MCTYRLPNQALYWYLTMWSRWPALVKFGTCKFLIAPFGSLRCQIRFVRSRYARFVFWLICVLSKNTTRFTWTVPKREKHLTIKKNKQNKSPKPGKLNTFFYSFLHFYWFIFSAVASVCSSKLDFDSLLTKTQRNLNIRNISPVFRLRAHNHRQISAIFKFAAFGAIQCHTDIAITATRPLTWYGRIFVKFGNSEF